MAFLGRVLKVDLICLAEELGETVTEGMKHAALKNIILASTEYEEGYVKELLKRIADEREKAEEMKRKEEIKRQERAKEIKRHEREEEIKRQDRIRLLEYERADMVWRQQYEREKLKIEDMIADINRRREMSSQSEGISEYVPVRLMVCRQQHELEKLKIEAMIADINRRYMTRSQSDEEKEVVRSDEEKEAVESDEEKEARKSDENKEVEIKEAVIRSESKEEESDIKEYGKEKKIVESNDDVEIEESEVGGIIADIAESDEEEDFEGLKEDESGKSAEKKSSKGGIKRAQILSDSEDDNDDKPDVNANREDASHEPEEDVTPVDVAEEETEQKKVVSDELDDDADKKRMRTGRVIVKDIRGFPIEVIYQRILAPRREGRSSREESLSKRWNRRSTVAKTEAIDSETEIVKQPKRSQGNIRSASLFRNRRSLKRKASCELVDRKKVLKDPDKLKLVVRDSGFKKTAQRNWRNKN